MKRHAGFTLIEMIVVIVIIALMSSVAVPAYFRSLAHMKFTRSVQQVVSLLAWARSAAIESSADATVQFDLQSGTITVHVQQPDPGTDQPAALQDEQSVVTARQPRVSSLGEDISVTDLSVTPNPAHALQAGAGPVNGGMPPSSNAGAQAIHFYDDGTADTARFALVSADGYHTVIQVVQATGRAVVSDENP